MFRRALRACRVEALEESIDGLLRRLGVCLNSSLREAVCNLPSHPHLLGTGAAPAGSLLEEKTRAARDYYARYVGGANGSIPAAANAAGADATRCTPQAVPFAVQVTCRY